MTPQLAGGQSGQTNGSGLYYIAEKGFDGYIKDDAKFVEEFVEVNLSGSYRRPQDVDDVLVDDGTIITLTSGMRFIYIVYTKI